MQRKTQIIPKATAARMMMTAGAKRVSQEATDTFADTVMEIAMQIGKKAVEIAHHSGRKTVQEKDIKLAIK